MGKIIEILGVQGKKVDIIPTTKGQNLTEIFNKKFVYLGCIIFDKRWKKYVLAQLDPAMQMSKDCIDEAFKLTEDYWNGER